MEFNDSQLTDPTNPENLTPPRKKNFHNKKIKDALMAGIIVLNTYLSAQVIEELPGFLADRPAVEKLAEEAQRNEREFHSTLSEIDDLYIARATDSYIQHISSFANDRDIFGYYLFSGKEKTSLEQDTKYSIPASVIKHYGKAFNVTTTPGTDEAGLKYKATFQARLVDLNAMSAEGHLHEEDPEELVILIPGWGEKAKYADTVFIPDGIAEAYKGKRAPLLLDLSTVENKYTEMTEYYPPLTTSQLQAKFYYSVVQAFIKHQEEIGHPIKSFTFVGYSFGGSVSFATAYEMQSKGYQINRVVGISPIGVTTKQNWNLADAYNMLETLVNDNNGHSNADTLSEHDVSMYRKPEEVFEPNTIRYEPGNLEPQGAVGLTPFNLLKWSRGKVAGLFNVAGTTLQGNPLVFNLEGEIVIDLFIDDYATQSWELMFPGKTPAEMEEIRAILRNYGQRDAIQKSKLIDEANRNLRSTFPKANSVSAYFSAGNHSNLQVYSARRKQEISNLFVVKNDVFVARKKD